MKIDIRFDENMNRPKYFVTKKKPNKKIEIFEIRTEATKQLDFVIILIIPREKHHQIQI